jgi:CarD family transcriptional regulator
LRSGRKGCQREPTMYSTGDKVVHPGYGPGIIRGIERREMLGEAKQYYIIDMQTSGGTLMTPVAQAGKIGLRPAISKATVKKLLRSLSEAPTALSEDFRERQTDIEERLKEGDIFEAARVLRDLAWYGQVQGLTKRDSQLMQRAEEVVSAEMALVEDVEIKEAASRVQAALDEVLREQNTD